ncbi:MAG: ATP-binding cassette domain-containing protein [Christensenella sp.]|nr:ATP-binding cassette domain-containing protein [Christensenella sp.]
MNATAKLSAKEEFMKNLRYFALIAIVGVLFLVFGLINPAFVGFSNIMNITRQIGVLAIISIGMTFVILTGGIDLSVGSNIAVSGMLGASVFQSTGNVAVALIVTLVCATLFGLVNGVIIGKFGIAPFIVTLAMQSVGRGATMLIGGAASIKINNEVYKFIGQGGIFNIPAVLLILFVLYIVFIIVNDKSVFGRHIYAIGGNINAAAATGINVKKSLLKVYGIAGFLAGIGAIVTVGRMGSAQPYAGNGDEFSAITAVVLGGTSLVGGTGNLKGTLLGAVLVGVINNGLSLMQVDKFFQYIVTGLLILAAVIIDIIIMNYRNKKLTPKLAEKRINGNEGIQVSDIGTGMPHVLEMKNITKVFPGMKALDNVSIMVKPGEVHALMGENGAGKSTLMKILSGEEKASLGQIYIDGRKIEIEDPLKAKEVGIALIHQELALIPELTVAQNIFLGKEIRAGIPFIVKHKEMEKKAQKVLKRLGLHIDAGEKVKNLTVSEQQMIEIAKALETNAWLIIMDEPTSSLTDKEKEHLFEIIRKLKSEGISVIYISHRMQEIFTICDSITILRDGKDIGTHRIKEIDERKIISLMVGRELNNIFDRVSLEPGNVVLNVEKLGRDGVFDDISFCVREGEVLGFSGLIGAGRTEIARCLFGLDKLDRGIIRMEGKKVNIRNAEDAINLGIAYVPEDRKKDGFIPFMSIRENIAMPSYGKLSKNGLVITSKEKAFSQNYVRALSIKTTSDEKNVVELSGGNQQKVSLAKWLATKPKLLILDEPTRGIDVGAKEEIHHLIAQIAKEGVAIIIISSEMPELIGCADKIIVLREGKITAEMKKSEASQDSIMQMAAL